MKRRPRRSFASNFQLVKGICRKFELPHLLQQILNKIKSKYALKLNGLHRSIVYWFFLICQKLRFPVTTKLFA